MPRDLPRRDPALGVLCCVLSAYLQQALGGQLRVIERMRTPFYRIGGLASGSNKDAAADVVVGVRRTVVVDVERPVILVLVVVPAMVQARVTTVEIPVIRDHRLRHS